ncbi:hypothetical protein ACRRTK_020025 [Alexandromys fortis]
MSAGISKKAVCFQKNEEPTLVLLELSLCYVDTDPQKDKPSRRDAPGGKSGCGRARQDVKQPRKEKKTRRLKGKRKWYNCRDTGARAGRNDESCGHDNERPTEEVRREDERPFRRGPARTKTLKFDTFDGAKMEAEADMKCAHLKITLNDTAACEEGLLIIQLGANEKLRSERSGDGKERMESRWSLKEACGARARCRWD